MFIVLLFHTVTIKHGYSKVQLWFPIKVICYKYNCIIYMYLISLWNILWFSNDEIHLSMDMQ